MSNTGCCPPRPLSVRYSRVAAAYTNTLAIPFIQPELIPNSPSSAGINMAAIDTAIAAANAASVATTGAVEVLVPAGEFYVSGSFSGRSNVTFTCAGIGKTKFYMPAANYPNTVYQQKDSTSVLISACGELSGSYTPLENFEMRNFSIESENGDGRYTYPIIARNVKNLRIYNVEVFGISIGNCLTLDTVVGGEITGCRLHDCTTATAGAVQLSGIETDANRVNSANSKALHIHHNWIEDLTMTGAAFPGGINMQTDGINLGVGNNHGHSVHDNYIRNVGEGIDCFSSECVIHDNRLIDCTNGALKFVHGASRNVVHSNSIMRPGLAGIYLGGSDVGIVADNAIYDNVIDSVNNAGAWPVGYGIKLDVDPSDTYKPSRNTISRNKIVGDVSNLNVVIRQDDGTDNRFIENECDAGAPTVYSDIALGTATVVNAKKTLVRAGCSSTEATAAGVEEIVPYGDEEIDTQGEYNAGTKIFTASSHRRLSVQAVLRIISSAGEIWTLRIKKNGVARAAVLSYSGGNPTQIRIHDAFEVAPGDTVAVYVEQGNGDRDCGGGSNGSYLTIEEVAG